MRTIAVLALVVLAAGAVTCQAEGTRSQTDLLKEYQAAKLGQIALVVKDLSQGKSRVLIGQGASANPRVGLVSRAPEWGDLPLISVYPVSESFKTKLEGIEDCVVIGAVSLLASAIAVEPPGAPESANPGVIIMEQRQGWALGCPAGVYLLAYKGERSDSGEKPGTVFLVSVAADKDGNGVFTQSLGVPASCSSEKYVSRSGEIFFGATVQFTGKDKVSRENPARRATVSLSPHDPDVQTRCYTFQLDLRVTME